MTDELKGMRVAILATDGVEEIELEKPLEALKNAGAKAEVVSPKTDHLQGYDGHEMAHTIKVDRALDTVRPDDYQALVLPGGVANPDELRINDRAVAFVRSFVQSGKPVAAICHGPWTLINAGGVRGRRMTSWPSLEADLRNAGANWVDEAVVRDQNLVTSRKPADLPKFCEAMIEEFRAAAGTGRHAAE